MTKYWQEAQQVHACIQKAVPCMYVHIRLRGIKGNECSLGGSGWLHSWFTIEIMLIWIVHFQLFIPKAALNLLSSICVLAVTYKSQEQLQELELPAPAIFSVSHLRVVRFPHPAIGKKSWVHLI